MQVFTAVQVLPILHVSSDWQTLSDEQLSVVLHKSVMQKSEVLHESFVLHVSSVHASRTQESVRHTLVSHVFSDVHVFEVLHVFEPVAHMLLLPHEFVVQVLAASHSSLVTQELVPHVLLLAQTLVVHELLVVHVFAVGSHVFVPHVLVAQEANDIAIAVSVVVANVDAIDVRTMRWNHRRLSTAPVAPTRRSSNRCLCVASMEPSP